MGAPLDVALLLGDIRGRPRAKSERDCRVAASKVDVVGRGVSSGPIVVWEGVSVCASVVVEWAVRSRACIVDTATPAGRKSTTTACTCGRATGTETRVISRPRHRASRRNCAGIGVTAGVCRRNPHSNVITVDQADVISDTSGNRIEVEFSARERSGTIPCWGSCCTARSIARTPGTNIDGAIPVRRNTHVGACSGRNHYIVVNSAKAGLRIKEDVLVAIVNYLQ